MKKICTILVSLFWGTYIFAQCNTSVDLAYGKQAYASSIETPSFPASNAFDNNLATRWSSAYSDPQYIYVDLGIAYPLCEVVLNWETAYGKNFTIDISNDAATWTNVATITNNASTTNTISITGTGRYVRMYGTARATGYGYSLYEFQVYGTTSSPSCPSINIALNQPAVTSSLENGSFSASYAFDGSMSTRWSSAYSDPQYIYVDLGATYSICNVNLYWENAYGKDFTIDASDDASTWTTLSTITNNTLTTNIIPLNGAGRYVRMYGIARGTGYGYSLYEFVVNGTIINVLPISLVSFDAIGEGGKLVLLNWVCENGSDTKSFEVERSADNLNFKTIGDVESAGNSNLRSSYYFTDSSANYGANFYRLKLINLNGSYSYSKIIEYNAEPLSTTLVYPNPVSDILNIKTGSDDFIESISLYSTDGTMIINQKVSGNVFAFSTKNLPAGFYVLHVISDKNRKIFKVVKQ